MSTTADRNVIDEAGMAGTKGTVNFNLTAPKGSHAFDVNDDIIKQSDHKGAESQSELIFPRNTLITIDKVTHDAKTNTWELHGVVGDKTASPSSNTHSYLYT